MFRRGVFRDVGEWNPRAGSALDYDLYLRVTRRFAVTCHDAEIADYRRHASNMSRNAVLMLRDTLGALAEQSTHVQRDRRLREAYRSGRRFWRDLYGEDAVQQVRLLVRDRRWTQALGQLGLLLRLHPRGFVELVRPGR
jgi:hypothetical protein